MTCRNCKVKVDNFDLIIDHEYFIFTNDLARQLYFDREDSTLMLPFDQRNNKKSRLREDIQKNNQKNMLKNMNILSVYK